MDVLANKVIVRFHEGGIESTRILFGMVVGVNVGQAKWYGLSCDQGGEINLQG